MDVVKSVKKLFFNSNFGFYFEFLAVGGTEKCDCVQDLSLSWWEGVYSLSLRCEDDVQDLSLRYEDDVQNLSLKNRFGESHIFSEDLWTVLQLQ